MPHEAIADAVIFAAKRLKENKEDNLKKLIVSLQGMKYIESMSKSLSVCVCFSLTVRTNVCTLLLLIKLILIGSKLKIWVRVSGCF